MMDWEESSGSSSEDEDELTNHHRAVTNIRNKDTSNSKGSIRGLQMALVEGWLVQRARDMCSFTHDRYRQAALAEAENLPQESAARMSLRVSPLLTWCDH